MAVTKVNIEQFLLIATNNTIIDVRSEGEFTHAHIPGAHNIPLFNNQERALVGTAYKQQSRKQAIKLGLSIFGPKMVSIVEEAERLTARAVPAVTNPPGNGTTYQTSESEKVIAVHCWRGGMRSAGVAWLLNLYGFNVYTLAGGYKAFRNWALNQFIYSYPFNILGGFTGSGKTFTLHYMKQLGAVVIDLESLASHKGSAFGKLGMPAQPSQEMFENRLSVELWSAKTRIEKNVQSYNSLITPEAALPTGDYRIWLEDESQRIGNVNIPNALWATMRGSPVIFMELPFDQRLNHIIEHYGKFAPDEIENAIIRIKKRLGGLQTKDAINYLHEGNIEDCFRILLTYYDRLYKKSLHSRAPGNMLINKVACSSNNPELNAADILKTTEQR